MARMKFLCDAERCIECNACVTACKNEHEVPWGVNRRRVVTIQDGKPGERSISVACMHCSDAPCMAVCPVDCFYQTDQGVVLHSKDLRAWGCNDALREITEQPNPNRFSLRTTSEAAAAVATAAARAAAAPAPSMRRLSACRMRT